MDVARRRRLLLTVTALVAMATIGTWIWHEYFSMPRKFGEVAAGKLYRSAEITPNQLERVTRRYAVKTVLSLLDPSTPESVAERQRAEQLGIRWLNVRLPGDGASTADERDEIRRILLDDSNGPTLVHCAAGANRTGLACGMFRISVQGWSYERALEEMRRYGFDDLAKHENLREALRLEAAIAASRPSSRVAAPE